MMFVRTRDEAVERRAHLQVVDVAACDLDGHLRLVALLAQDRGRCDRRLALALDVHLELREALARFFEQQQVLRREHGADQLVVLRVELGAPHVEARLQQRDFVFGRLHRGFGLGLGNLLIGELQVELGLLERELLLGRIELDDHVAGFDRGARRHEAHDRHLAANRRDGELHRADRAQLAGGVHRHVHPPALHAGRRDLPALGSDARPAGGHAGDRENGRGGGNDPALHFDSPAARSRSEIRSPSWRPDWIAT